MHGVPPSGVIAAIVDRTATDPLSTRHRDYRPWSVLDFRILGPLEVVDGATTIALGGPKQRATLAILLLSANRLVSVEQLAEDLYAGAPPVTAVTQVQRQISELRKALGPEAGIETRAPGYVIRFAPERLDLHRFEQLAEQAADALAGGDAEAAADGLRRALALWRGAPLADLAYESFAQSTIARLEEIRLAALELRIDADLALGRHATLVPELESLVWDHPVRERLHGQLMLALYRSGRQPEALAAYRKARAALVDAFGIEPSRALQVLERAILAQDPSLDVAKKPSARAGAAEEERTALLLPSRLDRVGALLSVGERLARLPRRELLIARLVADGGELEETVGALNAYRSTLDVPLRTAAFTSADPTRDAVRLATEHDVELVLLDAPAELDGAVLPPELAAMLAHSPADVAVVTGDAVDWGRGSGVYVPFGGVEHDWAALELAAQLAHPAEAPLRLLGTSADPSRGRRDASRLLADASLTLQRVTGVDVEPVLAEPHADALLDAVGAATVVVTGISARWRAEGIGAAPRALVGRSPAPVLLVHRGPRPGVLAPRASRTRFSWSVES
jgi:DNA-binding SARP family transcriptional activator